MLSLRVTPPATTPRFVGQPGLLDERARLGEPARVGDDDHSVDARRRRPARGCAAGSARPRGERTASGISARSDRRSRRRARARGSACSREDRPAGIPGPVSSSRTRHSPQGRGQAGPRAPRLHPRPAAARSRDGSCSRPATPARSAGTSWHPRGAPDARGRDPGDDDRVLAQHPLRGARDRRAGLDPVRLPPRDRAPLRRRRLLPADVRDAAARRARRSSRSGTPAARSRSSATASSRRASARTRSVAQLPIHTNYDRASSRRCGSRRPTPRPFASRSSGSTRQRHPADRPPLRRAPRGRGGEGARAYPALAGRRVVLYAPTFRGESAIVARQPDRPRPRSAARGPRQRSPRPAAAAPFVRRSTPTSGPELADFVVDASAHPDIHELMLVSDVLVTDYSSAIYEFSLLGRPMVFFAPDLAAYEAERGFYFDYRSGVPGPSSRRPTRLPPTCAPAGSTWSASRVPRRVLRRRRRPRDRTLRRRGRAPGPGLALRYHSPPPRARRDRRAPLDRTPHRMTLRARPVARRRGRAGWDSGDRRNSLINLGFFLAIGLSILILVGYAALSWYDDHYGTAATVNGQAITKDDLRTRIEIEGFRLDNVESQSGRWSPRAASAARTATSSSVHPAAPRPDRGPVARAPGRRHADDEARGGQRHPGRGEPTSTRSSSRRPRPPSSGTRG